MNLLAQNVDIQTGEGTESIQGPLVNPLDPNHGPITSVADVINIVIPFLFSIAGVLLFLYLAWGGYDFLLSQGSPEKIKSGQAKMTSAIIGFVLLLISYLLVKVIAGVLGLSSSFL